MIIHTFGLRELCPRRRPLLLEVESDECKTVQRTCPESNGQSIEASWRESAPVSPGSDGHARQTEAV